MMLRQPLMMLPNYINSVINARVSIARLQAYLQVRRSFPSDPTFLGGVQGNQQVLSPFALTCEISLVAAALPPWPDTWRDKAAFPAAARSCSESLR